MPLYKVEHVPDPQTDPPTNPDVSYVIANNMRRGIRDVEDSFLPVVVEAVSAIEISLTVVVVP